MSLREEVLARDACRCRRCGFAAADGDGLEVSHITPRLRGGPDLPENVALLCTPCHTDWHRAEREDAEFSAWVTVKVQPKADRPQRRGRPDGILYPWQVFTYLCDERYRKAKELAQRRGVSMTQLFRDLLDEAWAKP